MSGVSLAEELRAHQAREGDGEDVDSVEEDQREPVPDRRAGRNSIAHPENDADVEFNVFDEGSLQAYLADLVGEVVSEAPNRRDIHNLTLRFSSPGRATSAQVLVRLASFMKLAGETLQAELGAVRAGQDTGPTVQAPRRPQGPGLPARPAAAPPARNSPRPTDLLTVFATVPRT